MDTRRVDVLGGGPGGLFAARLIKIAFPRWVVTVYERDQVEETFGFGYGLTPATLRNLAEADATVVAQIKQHASLGHGHVLYGHDGIARLHGARNIAIGRKALLELLSQCATESGVKIQRGRRVDLSDLDSDIVIAADGVRSSVREKLASELGADVEVGHDYLMWCGVDIAFNDACFLPVRTEHGLFVAHGYPYAADRSTLVIEADLATLRSAGLDVRDGGGQSQPDGPSLGYLSSLFAELLEGRPLLGNRSSRWSQFATVKCDRWHYGSVVLIGDAAHTAHPSIGSGTKLAMEDAIALASCLREHLDLEDAFQEYERRRRPDATRLQNLAHRSQLWWESFPSRASLPVANLAVSFMTRAGRISLFDFLTTETATAVHALANYAAQPAPEALSRSELCQWVLSQPLDLRSLSFPTRSVSSATLDSCSIDLQPTAPDFSVVPTRTSRNPAVAVIRWTGDDAWGDIGEEIAARSTRQVAEGVELLWVSGAPGREAVLSRLDLAERLRLATAAAIGVDIPNEFEDIAVTALVAARCDLVRLSAAQEL